MFKTEAEKSCLREYIKQKCTDDKPVPDVIHLLWYGRGTQQLDLRSKIGLYSLLTMAEPCLIVLHGNVEMPGPLWNKILPLATNVVRVHKNPQTHISGRRIVQVQNQADIGRIEILLGKIRKDYY